MTLGSFSQNVVNVKPLADNRDKSICEKDSFRFAVRGNTFSWLTLAPHVEFDYFFQSHWDVSLGGAYGWWGFNGDQHALQTWKICTEGRYYFLPSAYIGHSLGLRLETGQIDARLSKYGRRGQLSTIGITYAYTWKLGKTSRWYLDAGIGAGYIYADYIKYVPYKPTECYHKLYRKYRSVPGLTNVSINISYRFPVKNKK